MRPTYSMGFKTPADYWTELLAGDPARLNDLPLILCDRDDWTWDGDLHIYPYTHALPTALSFGCPNRCAFCPTAAIHKGITHYADYERVLRYYGRNEVLHFMDENFFHHPELTKVLCLLREQGHVWLAMSDYLSTDRAFEVYGEKFLYDCGCRIVEIGLENIPLCRKVPREGLQHDLIEFYYLNMTMFPGETKDSIRETAGWMRRHSVRRPIHFNNGLWYAPGQWYFDYGTEDLPGLYIPSPAGRSRPTFIPQSFLDEEVEILDAELVNYYCQLVYDFKLLPVWQATTVEAWLEFDEGIEHWKKVAWLTIGLRVGGVA